MYRRASELGAYLTEAQRATDPVERAYYEQRIQAWTAELEDIKERQRRAFDAGWAA